MKIIEDGKPFAKEKPNDTATTNTTSPKQRDLSHIQRNKGKLCDWYGGDGENWPSVPERIMVDTVEENKGIVPTPGARDSNS